MSEFDKLLVDVLDGLITPLSLKDILSLSKSNLSNNKSCVTFLRGHPCKWLDKAVAAGSVPAVMQVLEHFPWKGPVGLHFMMRKLLRIRDVPAAVVELLVQYGAVPTQSELLAAVKEGIPGLEVWPNACKTLGVPTRLSPLAQAIWCNEDLPVRL